jgi:Ser/Thr protein kinase RdoA (MazF antagonist)
MHGDLHGENVRVRNGNAILIDFASVCSGPLTADLAALETCLAFELPPEERREDYENAQ